VIFFPSRVSLPQLGIHLSLLHDFEFVVNYAPELMLNKEIHFTKHVLDRCSDRGTTEEEIVQAIRESMWKPAKEGKMECRATFTFNAIWGAKFYAKKDVRPIFAENKDSIVVVSVYTYYY
jgi:hypothetical protein